MRQSLRSEQGQKRGGRKRRTFGVPIRLHVNIPALLQRAQRHDLVEWNLLPIIAAQIPSRLRLHSSRQALNRSLIRSLARPLHTNRWGRRDLGQQRRRLARGQRASGPASLLQFAPRESCTRGNDGILQGRLGALTNVTVKRQAEYELASRKTSSSPLSERSFGGVLRLGRGAAEVA